MYLAHDVARWMMSGGRAQSVAGESLLPGCDAVQFGADNVVAEMEEIRRIEESRRPNPKKTAAPSGAGQLPPSTFHAAFDFILHIPFPSDFRLPTNKRASHSFPRICSGQAAASGGGTGAAAGPWPVLYTYASDHAGR